MEEWLWLFCISMCVRVFAYAGSLLVALCSVTLHGVEVLRDCVVVWLCCLLVGCVVGVSV